MRETQVFYLGYIALAAAVFFIALMTGCSDPVNAQRILNAQGYTHVVTTGWRYGCGRDDWYATGFIAASVTGQYVDGVVCQGLLFKGATVRILNVHE